MEVMCRSTWMRSSRRSGKFSTLFLPTFLPFPFFPSFFVYGYPVPARRLRLALLPILNSIHNFPCINAVLLRLAGGSSRCLKVFANAERGITTPPPSSVNTTLPPTKSDNFQYTTNLLQHGAHIAQHSTPLSRLLHDVQLRSFSALSILYPVLVFPLSFPPGDSCYTFIYTPLGPSRPHTGHARKSVCSCSVKIHGTFSPVFHLYQKNKV